MSTNQPNEIWNEFLKNWPIDKVKSMTLEQYTKSGDNSTFTYWVEVGTRNIAEIRGSTALKFGIYNRKNTTKKFIANGIICDSQYAWYGKYGSSKDEAFQNIKNNILKIIAAVKAQDINLLSQIDISPMVKWKIAFLYQDRDNPIIMPIFSLSWLKSITKNNSITYPLAYSQLKVQMGKQPLFDYANSLVEKYKQAIPEKNQNDKPESDNELNISIIKQPLNQILFGPAGTGKTYHTIDQALKILDPSLIEELESEDNSYDRETLKIKFDEFVARGQVKFVTFHQSFSYEDFIEGIRAESFETELENGNKIKTLEYPVKDGVFLELCKNATTKVIKPSEEDFVNLANIQSWKMSLGRSGQDEEIYEYCMKNSCILLGWGEDLNFSNCNNYKEVEGYMQSHGYEEYLKNSPKAASFIHNFKNLMKKDDLVIVSDGNHKFRAIGKVIGDYEFLDSEDDELPDYRQMRRVQWLRQYSPSLPNERLLKANKNFSMPAFYQLAHIDHQKLTELLSEDSITDFSDENFVIIIDEINRGNISKIFGELITLIEPDKRKGEAEEISVILPYSKRKFSVPNNVYIIGTMNSSDRSLTGIDIALRRRFTFIEMPPKPEELKEIEIEGINLENLLHKINLRIEVLLDKEHCIGHANFMSLNHESTMKDLANIFKRKVLPLLQEYFFEDWSKINMVLNDNGMLKKESVSIDKLFKTTLKDDLNYYENRELWKIDDSAFEDVQSYLTIIK